jgi:hypothetical protein
MRAGALGARARSADRASGLREAALLLAAILALSLPWSLPAAPDQLTPPALLVIAGETLLLLALLALLAPLRQGRLAAALRYGVGLATGFVVLLTVAELLIRSTLARPLNPLLDLHLAGALVHLLTGTLGGALGWLTLAGLASLPAVAALAAFQAMRVMQRLLGQRRWRLTVLALAALAAGGPAVQQAWPQAFAGRALVAFRASQTVAEQARRGQKMAAALAVFDQAARTDRFEDVPAEALLTRLAGVDVLLMFIESYGRSALEQERYAGTIVPRLDEFAARLAGAGLSAASGYLTSPTVGGQSWLAHGTLESGLWLSDQRFYDLMLIDHRLTLTKAFGRAGHRTVALKPAITLPWPEGQRLGFAKIYAAADLGYAGLPYNWVTMPDQYTLSVLEQRERGAGNRAGRPPLFAEVSLISSHAPWTPIPPVLDDWAAIGDGRVFSQWAELGDPPDVVWRDPARVRHQYTLAVDYVLGVLGSYAARFVDRQTLLILVGDHQPAPLVTGENASRDVPMHVISGDPALLAPFLAWGFTPGMLPAAADAPERMDAFRDWFLAAFSRPDGAADAASAQ